MNLAEHVNATVAYIEEYENEFHDNMEPLTELEDVACELVAKYNELNDYQEADYILPTESGKSFMYHTYDLLKTLLDEGHIEAK